MKHGEMRPYHGFWTPLGFFILLLLCLIKVARADEPCVLSPDGTQVICEKAGFDRAVQKCSDAIGGEAACKVKLDAALHAWEELSVKYKACVSDKPSTVKPMIGYVAGLAGLGAVVLSPTLPMGTEVKWGVSITGALMVALGFWAVVP